MIISILLLAETSCYIDLSTLYGNSEKEQERVRKYHNGLIHPDSIAGGKDYDNAPWSGRSFDHVLEES